MKLMHHYVQMKFINHLTVLRMEDTAQETSACKLAIPKPSFMTKNNVVLTALAMTTFPRNKWRRTTRGVLKDA